MVTILHLFSYPFLLAFFLTAGSTPLVIKFFRRQRWLDKPDKKKLNTTHLYPVPRGGGLPIALAIFLTSLLFLPADKKMMAILVAVFINLVVGLADDLYDLNPYLRLFTNLLAAVVIVMAGVKVEVLTNPFWGGVWHLPGHFLGLPLDFASLVTLVWLVWMTNVVGWAGGVEGQLPGLVVVAAIIISILGIQFSQDLTQWPLIILAATVAGAYLGFLPYNFYPQKIMPGYSGKSIAGLLLGVLAILSGAKLATAILVLGIPMADGLLAIIRRLSRGQSPVWGDAGYLHHLLLRWGLPRTQIAILYWLFSIILGILVLNLNSRQKLYAFLLLLVGLVAFTLWLRHWLRRLA